MDQNKLSEYLNGFLEAYSPKGKIGQVLDVTNLLMAGQLEYGIKSFFVAWLRTKDKNLVFALDKKFDGHQIDLLASAKGSGGAAIFTAEIKSTFLGDSGATTKCVEKAVAQARKAKSISRSKGQKKFLGKAAHFVIHFLNSRPVDLDEDFYPEEIEHKFSSVRSGCEKLKKNLDTLMDRYRKQGVKPVIISNARNPHLKALIAQIE